MPGWLQATILVALGGAIGSVGRYWVGAGIRAFSGVETFPLATFLINVTGSFLLAVFAWMFRDQQAANSQSWYLLLGVGLCGGYTTFSTFEVENYKLLTEGHYGLAALNALGSVVAGYLGVILGMQVGRWIG